jgi:hypothetical protein
MPEPPENADLVRSIERLQAEPHRLEENLRPLLGELLVSTLIAGRDGDLLTVDVDGDDYLALFTDLIELHMFEPGSPWEAIATEEALRQVAGGDYEGVVVNPRGRSFELSRDDVLDFFDFDED